MGRGSALFGFSSSYLTQGRGGAYLAKVIGVIGGMGPAATIDLLEKIYAIAKGKPEQEQVRVLVDIDPTIPDRTLAILNNQREEIIAHLLRNARGLVGQGADLLAMPCNTAHAFIKDLERELSVPILNIVEVTVQEISGSGSVGLMATDGTLAADLYAGQLRKRGVEVILPPPAEQAILMEAIYAFKEGEHSVSAKAVIDLYCQLLKAGAEQVIAACTELPLMLADQSKVIDPTALLAKTLVAYAYSG